jgi:hypothetical protein
MTFKKVMTGGSDMTYKKSAKVIEQRQSAAKTHGAYAFQARGEASLEPTGRTRLAELREQVQSREGVMDIMQQKAADSVLLFELVQSFVASEAKAGVPLDEIKALKALPAFLNTMQRALVSLISLMPDNTDVIDIPELQKKYRQENHHADN